MIKMIKGDFCFYKKFKNSSSKFLSDNFDKIDLEQENFEIV